MTTTADAIHAYVAAISNPTEETAAALSAHLADDAVVVGIVGGGTGKQAIVEALGNPKASRLLAMASWSEPHTAGDGVVLEAALPAGSPLGGMSIELGFDAAGTISSAGQSIISGAPAAATPIVITPEMQTVIDSALANGTPFVLSYVDAEGMPHLSLRGTVQVYDPQTLATWARDPGAGLPRAIATNQRVALLYRDPKARTNYTFGGRARIAADAETRDSVFANSPEVERNLDGRRRGVAILIDLDIVEGSGPTGRVNMRRT